MLIKDVLMRKDHDTLHPDGTDETDDEILGLPIQRSRANKKVKIAPDFRILSLYKLHFRTSTHSF